MKDMKIHEGAGLGAAFGGRHDRMEGKNEHTENNTRCVRSCLPSDRAARQSRAPNPAFVFYSSWIFMNSMVNGFSVGA